jgi:hypothetical protein
MPVSEKQHVCHHEACPWRMSPHVHHHFPGFGVRYIERSLTLNGAAVIGLVPSDNRSKPSVY